MAELKNTRTRTLAALLAAIYAVSYSPFAGNIIIIPGVFEIRLGFLSIALAGALFGPMTAAIVAVIGDVIGTLLFYGGSFYWGYTLSWAIMGLGFGSILYKERFTVPRIILASVFNTVIINLALTTLWQWLTGVGPSYAALLITRIPRNLILLPMNTLLLLVVLRSVCVAYRKLIKAR
jgi:ECF transporter S component (folate family)